MIELLQKLPAGGPLFHTQVVIGFYDISNGITADSCGRKMNGNPFWIVGSLFNIKQGIADDTLKKSGIGVVDQNSVELHCDINIANVVVFF